MTNEGEKLLKELKDAIVSCQEDEAKVKAQEILKAGIDPIFTLQTVMTESARIIGEKFDNGEYFLPHLVMAGDAMMAASAILEKAIPKESNIKKVVVIATVEADMHSVGKNIVGMMLKASGFEVYDLGVDVKSSEIIRRAQELNADFIALSSLLTTTMPYQREVIDELKAYGIRDRFKVVVGGGPVRKDWADKIGADGYGKDAIEAVKVFKQLAGME
ncbi:Cobalamin (vitamin B12)-binding domain [Moorella glycerini]|uniref:Methionine synthase n=1 Tax=Neomoorella stamsii TaxID=1266720 RepID=A0A9X7J5U2_9FIRM|nr:MULTISPECIES: corrinoid protein [Moorella]PRR77181.1 Methionine synthase [Moorella stamsii]CEP67243.1 Cobalamin (vitamin B12)-binding domain [Moorella glycerini]